MPTCSIVLPISYRPSLAYLFLKSLRLSPSPGLDIQVIAVLDARDTVTRRVVEPFDGDVQVVQSEGQGLFGEWNDGAAAATGEYLVFLDCDALPQAGWLGALVDLAATVPTAAAIGSKLLLPRDIVAHAGIVFDRERQPRTLYTGFPADHGAVNHSRRLQAVSLSCGLVRRAAFEDVGGFDSSFREACGDVDLCLRLGQRGFDVYYCHRSVLLSLGAAADTPQAEHRRRLDRQAFAARWDHVVQPDDIQQYVADGLVSLEYSEAYPLKVTVSPLLGELDADEDDPLADLLLGRRTRQVVALARENARLESMVAGAALGRAGPTPYLGDPGGVNVLGYLTAENGLGAVARGYVRALRSLGVPVALKDVSDMAPHRAEDRSIRASDAEYPYAVNLICANADQHFAIVSRVGEDFFRGRYNIGVWFWELPHFPEEWRDRFQHYSEVWAATSFMANTLSPVSPVPVVRVPAVLEHDRHRAGPGARERGRRLIGATDDQFVVLFIFDFWSFVERKNPLGLIEAFKRAFPDEPTARLVIKCVNEGVDPAAFDRLQASAGGHNISILTGYWTAEEMRDLVAGCDAYASLHRAEGLGLTMSDAMALGKPVIATAWSGNADFTTSTTAYPVSYELVEIAEDIGPYRKGSTWAEPCAGHAAALLREVFEDREGSRRRGRAGRREIARTYSLEAVSKLIQARLDVVRRQIERPILPPGRLLGPQPDPVAQPLFT